MQKVRNLRGVIETEIGGKSARLVTFGHVASALGRTTTCVRQWETVGTFPEAPFRLTKGQLRLYPAEFVRLLNQIRLDGYLGRRLDETDRRRFQLEVWGALDLALATFKSEPGGVAEQQSDDEMGESRQA